MQETLHPIMLLIVGNSVSYVYHIKNKEKKNTRKEQIDLSAIYMQPLHAKFNQNNVISRMRVSRRT